MANIPPTNFTSPLSGNETLRAFGMAANGQPSGQDFYLTTGQIAALGALESTVPIQTAITTVGNGVLTAAALVGGQILRSGPTGPFTDTTDTAANIIAALPSATPGQTFKVAIKNTTAFNETLAAGVGVTLPTTVIIPGLSTGNYYVTVNSPTAVTFTHQFTVPTNSRLTTFRSTAQVDKTDTTLVGITGLTGMPLSVGTYAFTINLYGTAGGTGGWKIAFSYTTAVLSALNANAMAYTAAAVAVSNTTTTTTQTSIIASNTAFTNATITGTMVVSTAGTVDLQFAENSANSTSSIFVGSTMLFSRIG